MFNTPNTATLTAITDVSLSNSSPVSQIDDVITISYSSSISEISEWTDSPKISEITDSPIISEITDIPIEPDNTNILDSFDTSLQDYSVQEFTSSLSDSGSSGKSGFVALSVYLKKL